MAFFPQMAPPPSSSLPLPHIHLWRPPWGWRCPPLQLPPASGRWPPAPAKGAREAAGHRSASGVLDNVPPVIKTDPDPMKGLENILWWGGRGLPDNPLPCLCPSYRSLCPPKFMARLSSAHFQGVVGYWPSLTISRPTPVDFFAPLFSICFYLPPFSLFSLSAFF